MLAPKSPQVLRSCPCLRRDTPEPWGGRAPQVTLVLLASLVSPTIVLWRNSREDWQLFTVSYSHSTQTLRDQGQHWAVALALVP